MLGPYNCYQYQVDAIKFCLLHPQSMLFLDMGLGKTIITLSAITERISRFQCTGAVIFAPKRVCETVWKQEAAQWTHTSHLKVSIVTGSASERIRAAMVPADIYLVSYDNMAWYVDLMVEKYLSRGLYPPYNTAIFDEVTKLKTASTKRHGALRKLLAYLPYRVGLTGTPASNGYLDLFGQYLAIDSGARLGINFSDYTDAYFSKGYNAYEIELNIGGKEQIQARIADITLQMDSADYLTLPKVTFNDIIVTLPPASRALYRQLEDDLFFTMDSGIEIEVSNAAGLTNKCLQAANGAVYDAEGNSHGVHSAKLDALESIVEEAGHQPILVLVAFRQDTDRILERFPNAVYFGGSIDANAIMTQWNAGEIEMLVGHPASMAHGLNLQYGGHIGVWFGLNWSLDLYLQANARLDRQGQQLPVVIHRILAADTMDMAVLDALGAKAATQTELRQAIARYRR